MLYSCAGGTSIGSVTAPPLVVANRTRGSALSGMLAVEVTGSAVPAGGGVVGAGPGGVPAGGGEVGCVALAGGVPAGGVVAEAAGDASVVAPAGAVPAGGVVAAAAVS